MYRQTRQYHGDQVILVQASQQNLFTVSPILMIAPFSLRLHSAPSGRFTAPAHVPPLWISSRPPEGEPKTDG